MKHTKKLAFLLALSIGVSPCLLAINRSKINANEISTNTLEKDLIKAFEIFDKSLIKNSKNEIVNVDVKILEKHFGKDIIFDELKNILNAKNSYEYMNKSYFSCMKNAILEAFGVNFLTELSNYGIYELIVSKARSKLAKLMIKVATKTGTKMLGLKAIVALLAFYAVRCLI